MTCGRMLKRPYPCSLKQVGTQWFSVVLAKKMGKLNTFATSPCSRRHVPSLLGGEYHKYSHFYEMLVQSTLPHLVFRAPTHS